MAYERLTEPRITMEQLLAKPRSFSNLPAFLDPNGKFNKSDIKTYTLRNILYCLVIGTLF